MADPDIPVYELQDSNGTTLAWVRADTNTGKIEVDADGDNDIVYVEATSDDLQYVDANGNVVDTGEQATDVGAVVDVDGDRSHTDDKRITTELDCHFLVV